MSRLRGKKVLVVGASRGVGRKIAERAIEEGAEVLAAARAETELNQLQRETRGLQAVALDAADERAPEQAFGRMTPDVLVLSLGAIPPSTPVHELSWREFSVNWETDVKASFLFCRAALRRPLGPGSRVILISSGAAIGGSPISGGYAGAKRMQMFLAGYCQKEADRLNLGSIFYALAPARIMPETELGRAAVDGYSRYLGVPGQDFVRGMADPQTPADVAEALIELAAGPRREGSAFLISGKGLEPA